jgi:hypothetical protein
VVYWKTVKISFVIPVRNDADRLRRCLDSITRSGRDLNGLEIDIVVADSGSTDESAAVARAAGAQVILCPGARIGEQRNRGAAQTSGAILAFVDADHEIAPTWVATAVAILTDPEVTAAGAPYSPPRAANWVQRAYDGLRRHPVRPEVVEWLASGNLAVRRSSFVAAGGFDESLETCEDVDLSRKLRATGGRLVADERLASVHHGDPGTLGSVFLGELWRGRDNLRVSLRPPVSARTLVSAAIPVATLGTIVAGLAGACVSGTTWGRDVAALAAVGLIAIVAARAVRIRRGADTGGFAALAVAAAYELGRACAIAGRSAYSRRRPSAAAS